MAGETSAKRRRLEIENSLEIQHRLLQQRENDDYLEDGGDGCVVNQAISVLLVSKEIFSHLSNDDLLTCSVVNKTWNASARFTLREDRKCYAYISGNRQCRTLQKLINNVNNAWDIPFNGFSFSNNNAYDYGDPFSSSDSDTPGRLDLNIDDIEKIGGTDEHRCINTCENYDVTDLYAPLLSAFKIKYLRVQWEKEPKLDCPASKFIFELANNKSKKANNSIVGLTVSGLPSTAKNVTQYFGFDSNTKEPTTDSNVFPLVRMLELPKQRFSWSLDCNPISIVQDLISAVPRLQLLQGYVCLEFLPAILHFNKSSAVQEFSLELQKFRYKHLEILQSANNPNQSQNEDYSIVELLDFALAFAKEKPKIRKLIISTSCSPLILFHTEGIFECKTKALMISRMILESSGDVLRELCINHLDLVALAERFTSLASSGGSGVLVPVPIRLTRLAHITVECHEEIDALLAFSLLSRVNFDYNSIFPRLESIQINCKRFGYFIERDAIHPFLMENFRQLRMNHCFETVTKLHLNGEFRGSNANEVISDFAKLFPNVKTFIANMHECEQFEETCGALWTAWPELEFLRFQGVPDMFIKINLDPCFTGLPRKDCNYLLNLKKSIDLDRFKELQASPSLLSLTKLRHLQIEIHHFKNCEKSKTLNRVFLSELTGRYVFDQMPQLAVEIQRFTCEIGAEENSKEAVKCCFELEHLRPYVEFVHNFLPILPYQDC